METHVKHLFLLPVLFAGLNLIPTGRVTAQTFTTVHSFAPTVVVDNGNFTFGFTNSDGSGPNGLVLSGNILYGTASAGGSSDEGTVFAVNTDATGFGILSSFTASSTNSSGTFTNSDGSAPNGLVSSGNILYGTAYSGGTSGCGAVFAVDTDGTGFTNLHNFTGGDGGANPIGGLVLANDTLYGTANGGPSGAGTLFAIHTDGTGFTNLYRFSALVSGTNSDGAYPRPGLTLSGNTLYGATFEGGSSGSGTLFALNTDGSAFTNLHDFSPLDRDLTGAITNSDGANPNAGFVLTGNTLYGTAWRGGSAGNGTVFAVRTDGTGFTNLHSLSAGVAFDFGDSYTNSEGMHPEAGLTLSGNALYGAASTGGSSGSGTLFALNTDGSAFTNLHNFSQLNPDLTSPIGANTNIDGASPNAGLVMTGNTVYGTASRGGSAGNGTVFGLSLARPTVTITVSGPYTTLKWPANDPAIFASGFHVQTTTDPLPFSPATVWVNLPVVPTIMDGEFIAILANSYAAHRFYRLWQ